MSALDALTQARDEWMKRALVAERERTLYRNALDIIATSTYPARYVGETKDGMKLYGDAGDASRFARKVLDEGAIS